jgi:hypothetical protein
LLTQVWDRYADRPFFSSQLAVRNVRDAADVVVYLVNAAEDPAACGYLDPEMRILGWTGKPVVVLVNQLGAPRPAAQERAELERWAAHLAGYPWVRGLLVFDAFARCWVQEDVLLERIGAALPEDTRTRSRGSRQPGGAHEEVFRRAVDAGDGTGGGSPRRRVVAVLTLARRHGAGSPPRPR